ncbi:MAG: DUF11 domain-containing protein [Arenimonas sp.]|uniref:hypothetical protein n=1 Tax=Arenimonas sp. TaxID=1872635 RepID=UPI0025C4DFAB|nr:hypothetical protein [Arenimonas sp.]MBW8367687.1 DUF11 domain-containing protein [Arenimonas sp.]
MSLTGPAYTQNFDSLSNTAGSTTNSTLPTGWLLNETGGGARDNEQYAVDTGGSNSGDTYSYGAAGATDRALGGLLSGTLNPSFGACFTNDTGGEITALDIAYTGEQWRLGTAARTDRIDFQYSLDATSLVTGAWVDVDALDFTTPNTATVGAKVGNDAANRTALASQITGLAVATGANFCIRWTDFNASGADDGLAVDDFALTPTFLPPSPDISVEISATPSPVAAGGVVTLRTRFANNSPVASSTWNYAQQHPAALTFAGNTGFEANVGTAVSSCTTPSAAGAGLTCFSAGSSANSTNTFRADYTVAADAVGPLVITGSTTGPAEDGELDNNSDRLVLTLVGQEADLVLSLSDNADPASPGATVVYTAAISNAGPGAALGLRLSLPVPANTTFVSSSFSPALFDACTVVAGVLECSGSSLVAPGTSGNVVMTVQAGGTFVGNLSTTGTLSSDVVDSAPGNNTDTETTAVEVPTLAIHDLQGSGELSPVEGSLVQTEGIVTAVRSNGFNLQTAPGEEDANPATSQGILVFTGAAPPAAAAVGNRVRVSGTVIEFRSSSNPHQGFVTEITSPSVSLVSSGNALPAPIEITAALANPAGPVEALERLEAMRVSIATAVTTGPGEGFINESEALSSANGVFWAVVEGVARPFREPGVGVRDITPGIPVNTPRFDTNPERIRVQSTAQVGAPVIAVDAGATVTGLVGVLDYGFGAYNLLPDPTAPVVVTGGATPTAVADATAAEITLAGFNLLRFYDDVNDVGGDVPLSTLAFERRLRKTANAICEYVKLPDILGAVEVENLNALQRLADAINTNVPGTCTRNPQYVAYLEEGNDVGKINIGYLVSTAEVSAGVPRVGVVEVIQHGKTSVINNPNGSTSTLHDRPPLVLRAVVNASNGSSVPVTVIGNHLLSLIDINSLAPGSNGYATTGDRRRAKRGLQAQDTAALIHQYQLANPSERIVLLGDFNAFEFSDGYVDLMGIITGREAPADAVLAYFDSAITTPLTNMTDTSLPADRYSFSFEGSAQSLDHIVVNQAVLDAFAGVRIEHARINADFGTDNFGDDSVPLRVSDHDPVVLYLGDESFLTSDLSIGVTAASSSTVAGTATSFQSSLGNSGPDAASSVLVRFTANAELASVAVTPPAGFVCGAPVVGGGQTVVECAAAELAAGSVAFGVEAVTSPFQTGALTLTATVESLSTDLNPGNNVGAATVTLTAPVADLQLRMVEKPAAQVFGREATVGLQVSNRGPNASQTPQLAVVIAAGSAALTAEPASGWNCPILAATSARTTFLCSFTGAYADNRSDILRFKVRAVKSTVVNVSATVASPTADPVGLNNQATARFTVGLGN